MVIANFIGRARKLRRPVSAGLALLLTGAPLHSTEIGQNTPQRQLAQAYIAAIRAQDASAVKALWHPASRACENDATRAFFDQILARQLRDGLDRDSRYAIKSIEPVGAGSDAQLLGSRYYKFPVAPAYVMEVDARSATSRSIKIAAIVMYLAPANGSWFIDTPCPTPEGVAALSRK